MSNIYSDRTPYFYIIRHIPSGKKYAGARWGRGATPSELLTENGYKTSSSEVLNKIAEEGFECFEIICIKTLTDIDLDSVYEYETRFLKDHQCAQSNDWFNKHNNEHTDLFHSIPGEYQKCPDKKKKALRLRQKTNLERYGTVNVMNTPEGVEKTKKRMKENNPMASLRTNSGTYKKGHKPVITPERNKKISASKRGILNPMFGKKEASAHLNNTRVTCEVCGMETNIGNYKRWHGKNCRRG